MRTQSTTMPSELKWQDRARDSKQGPLNIGDRKLNQYARTAIALCGSRIYRQFIFILISITKSANVWSMRWLFYVALCKDLCTNGWFVLSLTYYLCIDCRLHKLLVCKTTFCSSQSIWDNAYLLKDHITQSGRHEILVQMVVARP